MADLPIVNFYKLSPNAKCPTKGSSNSAGYDLYSAQSAIVKSYQRVMVSTDLVMELPPNYYGRIASRSGLALNHSIDVVGGVIDSDYRYCFFL